MRSKTELKIQGWILVLATVCVAGLFAVFGYGLYNDIRTGWAVLFPKDKIPPDFETSTSLWETAVGYDSTVRTMRAVSHTVYCCGEKTE